MHSAPSKTEPTIAMLLNERGFIGGLKRRVDQRVAVAPIEFKCKFGTALPTYWGSRSTKPRAPVKSGRISRTQDGGSDATGMEVCNMDDERTVKSRGIRRKTIAQAAVALGAIFIS